MKPIRLLALFAAAVHASAAWTFAEEPRMALVMGVWEYGESETLPSLPGVDNDLAAMGAKLRELGFEVTTVPNPTLAQAEKAVDDFGARLRARGGVGLYYFSGHGAEFEGTNYLLPKSARVSSNRDLRDQALSANRVLNRMEESGAPVNLVFLDCCRNALTKSAGSGLAPMQASGVFVGFATASQKVAQASTEGSLYTRALVKHLGTPGLSITDMHTMVTAAVLTESRVPGATPGQTPFQYSGLNTIFYLRPAAAPRPALQMTPVPQPPMEVAKLELPKPVPLPPPLRTGSSVVATEDKPFINSLGMKFVPVAGTNALFSVWETRVQDYAVFAKETNREWRKPDFQQGPTHPAVNVSWDDAVAFCEWLSKKEGRTYRLPTDAEWSVAVGLGEEPGRTPEEKEGKVAGYPWGSAWPPPKGAGNYDSTLAVDNFKSTSPVGSFAANQFGLYDMGGNVAQWCEDWYDAKHILRVLRGASWFSHGEAGLRSSSRFSAYPAYRDGGFRCVLVISGG